MNTRGLLRRAVVLGVLAMGMPSAGTAEAKPAAIAWSTSARTRWPDASLRPLLATVGSRPRHEIDRLGCANSYALGTPLIESKGGELANSARLGAAGRPVRY